MQPFKHNAPLYVAITFGFVSSILVAIVALVQLDREIRELIILIAGALFTVTLTSVLRLLDQENYITVQKNDVPVIISDFDEDNIRKRFNQVTDAEFVEIEPVKSWEPTSTRLLAEDPVLALAKVRIDIEREVRRIVTEYNLMASDNTFNLVRILKNLEHKKLVSQDVFQAIRDVLPACNAAIHGQPVSLETARNVIEISDYIIRTLRATRRDSVTSDTIS